MNTHYHYNAAARTYVRSFYDRSITSWAWYVVSAPNDEADQLSAAMYQHDKPSRDLLDAIRAGDDY
jgi:hypothetical protein